MITTIIFDLDNTLIDFSERKNILISESVRAMIRAGLDEKFDVLLKDFTKFYWKTGIEDQRIFEKYLMKRYKRVDYKVLAHAILAYRKANAALLKPYPNAKKMLTQLKSKGYQLAVLTDAPKLEAHLRLASVGFDGFFDVIVTKDDTKALKPNPKTFKTILSKLKAKPEECVMVGDDSKKDIYGAKKCGMKTIYANYRATRTTEFVARSPLDVTKIINKMSSTP